MANDYIPADDGGLLSFANAFALYIGTNFAGVGLVTGDATALEVLVEDFSNRVSDNATSQTVARTSRALKDTSRLALVASLRSASRRIQAFPGTSEAELTSLGLTVKDTTPTAVAAPTSQPVLFVDTSKRLEHTINFRDAMTPLSTAKPAGAIGCEIYRKVGTTPPMDLTDCVFLGLDSASPFVVPFGSIDGGKTAYYMARWATRSGLTGPISDVISATVVA